MPKERGKSVGTIACAIVTAVGLFRPDALAQQTQNVFRQVPGYNHTVSMAVGAMRAKAAAARAIWGKTHPLSAQNSSGPKLRSGDVISSVIEVGNALTYPEVQFDYTTDGGPPLAFALFVFQSPSGTQQEVVYYALPEGKTTGKVTFSSNFPLGLFSQPGTWSIVLGTLIDVAGNETFYNEADLANVFLRPSFSVVNNGTVDSIAPTVASGTILTPVVKLNSADPTFRAQVSASDNLSGAYQLFIYFQPPGFPFSLASAFPLPNPILKGSIPYYFSLANAPTGKYPITSYEVCDFASNCLIDNNPVDIQTLFGATSFQVRN